MREFENGLIAKLNLCECARLIDYEPPPHQSSISRDSYIFPDTPNRGRSGFRAVPWPLSEK